MSPLRAEHHFMCPRPRPTAYLRKVSHLTDLGLRVPRGMSGINNEWFMSLLWSHKAWVQAMPAREGQVRWDRPRGAPCGAGTGEGWSRVPPLSVLPESWCHPRTGSASLPCARTLDLPQLDPPTCVTIAPVSFETREQSSWLISPLSWWQGWSKAWRPLRLCSVSPAVSAPRPPALCPNDPPRPWHLLLSRLSKFPPSRLRQTPSVPQTPGSSTTAGPASCPRT